MNTELQNWAKTAVAKCNSIAEEYYLDYYAFQKPCNLNYKILVLALNPYDKNSFPTKKVDVKTPSSMTEEKFLNGNSSWNGYKTSWKIIKQLMKMKLIDDLQLDFNYMNYVYFPSRKFNDIKKIKEVDILKESRELTLEFLRILDPDKIILLGTSSGSDQFDIKGHTLLAKGNKRLIVKGKLDEVDVYAIPHPSWLNDDELAAIDLNLREIFSNQKQSYFDFKKTTPSLSRIVIDLELKELNPITINNNYSDIIINGLDQEKILIRINYKNKIIGIRNTDKNNYVNLKYNYFYKSFFTNIISEKEQNWAIQKKFPSHFFVNNREITKEIFELYNGIINYK